MFPGLSFCWLNHFAFYWDPKKQGANFLDHTEAAAYPGGVPKQVSVGTRQHFHHLIAQGQSSVLSMSCSLSVGKWHWHFLNKQHFTLKSHRNKFMEKIHAFFICQGSRGLQTITLESIKGQGLWDHFPSGIRFTIKQLCRPSNKVRRTIKTLLKCPEKKLNNHLLQWRPEGHWQKLTLCHAFSYARF